MEEIESKKIALENAIRTLVQEFVNETGLEITQVSIYPKAWEVGRKTPVLYKVRVSAELPE